MEDIVKTKTKKLVLSPNYYKALW